MSSSIEKEGGSEERSDKSPNAGQSSKAQNTESTNKAQTKPPHYTMKVMSQINPAK